MSKDTDGCRSCNKTDFSLIPFRVSLVANDSKLAPAGADQVKVDDALVAGLVPKKKPKKSRYVLRLLREGYLYLYFPKPAEGTKHWRVFRVTKQADLIPEENELFNQWGKDAACNKPTHIPMGLKIADIPGSEEIEEFWIAWSANLWNDTVRARCAANPKAMRKIVLGGNNTNTFKPTADNLKGRVLECALPFLSIKGSQEHDFPFTSLSDRVESLAKRLELAAARAGAKGKQLAVALPDFAGLATDANGIRMRRHELAEIEMLEDKNLAYPLNTSNVILGLKRTVMEEVLEERYEKGLPIVDKSTFNLKMAQRSWPAGATWEPLPNDKEYWARYHGVDKGIVITPDTEQRFAADGPWVKERMVKKWERMAACYNEPALLQWRQDVLDKVKKKHYDDLVDYETDWWINIRQDEGFNNYFALQFDEHDPNDPKREHSPGYLYAEETRLATTPQPYTQGKVLEDYVAELTKNVADPNAVMLRALAANQHDVIVKMGAVLDVAGTADQIVSDRNDKLFDLGGALVKAVDPQNAQGAQRALYRWLSPGLGNLLCGATLHILQGLSGAALARAAFLTGGGAAAAAQAANTALAKNLLNRLMGAQQVQRMGEMALQSLVAGNGLKTPMLISKRYQLGHALALFRGRKDLASAYLVATAKSGYIDVSFLTDNHEMAGFNGDIDKAVASGAGRAELPGRPTAALLKPSALAATVKLADADYDKLFQRGAKGWEPVVHMAENAATHARTVLGSLDGRLGLGTMLLNWAGMQKALLDLNSRDARTARNAWLGLVDGISGVIGGAMLMGEVAATASIAARYGKDAVARTVGIHSLRFYGNLMGVVAGAVNGWAQWLKAGDAEQDGLKAVAYLYRLSAVSFYGTAYTASLLTAGALAQRQLTKGIANAAIEAAARKIAIRYGAGTVAGSAVSGYGLVLLGLAIVFEFVAAIRSPRPLELWSARAFFGTGKGTSEPKFGNWDEADIALKLIMESPKKPEPVETPDYTAP